MMEEELIWTDIKETLVRSEGVNKASEKQTARERAGTRTYGRSETRGFEQAPMAEADIVRAQSTDISVRAIEVNKGSKKQTTSKKQTLRDEQAIMNNRGKPEIRGIDQAPMAEEDLVRAHSHDTLLRAEGENKASKKHTVKEEQVGMTNHGQLEVRGMDRDPMMDEDPGQAERAAAANKTNKKAASNKAGMNTK
jgi:hypothetical protein